MLPPAPARLSTITGCFRISPSFGSNTRIKMSCPPPAAKGTTILIGLSGYVVVCAATGNAYDNTATNSPPHHLRNMLAGLMRSARRSDRRLELGIDRDTIAVSQPVRFVGE